MSMGCALGSVSHVASLASDRTCSERPHTAKTVTTMHIALARSRCVFLALATTLASASALADSSAPSANVDSGSLSGIHDAKTGLNEFKGIPYATPPIGALRW